MKKLLILAIITILSSVMFAQERGLIVSAKKLNPTYVPGKHWLLLIGIDKYKFWMPLQKPVKDMIEIKEIINRRYYIDETIELYNNDATKENVMKTFENLLNTVGVNDSLMIIYAGHGKLDNITSTGYWIPVDGGINSYKKDNWISNGEIRGFLGNMKSKHILLLSDSCFSGDLLNANRGEIPQINSDYFKNAFSRVSRQIVTSGASESVPDESWFARQIKLFLEGNNEPYVDPLLMFEEIRRGAEGTTPMYGTLKESGHQEGGSYLLFLKDIKESKSTIDLKLTSDEQSEINKELKLNQTFEPSISPTKVKTSNFKLKKINIFATLGFASNKVDLTNAIPSDIKVEMSSDYQAGLSICYAPFIADSLISSGKIILSNNVELKTLAFRIGGLYEVFQTKPFDIYFGAGYQFSYIKNELTDSQLNTSAPYIKTGFSYNISFFKLGMDYTSTILGKYNSSDFALYTGIGGEF